MAISMGNDSGRAGTPWRLVGWGGAALLLTLPYIANAPWTPADYVFMAVLFGLVGGAFEIINRASRSLAYRLGAAAAVVTAFMTVWVNAAVGMIGDGPYNLLFAGVLAVALLGAVMARFRPSGMALAMLAAAAVQAVLSAIGWFDDPRGGLLSMVFVVPWLVSAALFRAARDQGVAK